MKTKSQHFLKSTTFLLMFLASSLANAQRGVKDYTGFDLHFEQMELPNGVLGNSVTGIAQDSLGFVWFATMAGLVRYDGQNFTTFQHDPLQPNSLASDHLENLFIDSRGVLWLPHFNEAGLTSFDPATGIFTRYQHHQNDDTSLSCVSNSVVAEDRDGYIWIGGQDGLDRFDRKTGKFKHFRHDPNDERSLSCNQVRSLLVDKQGVLWVGTGFFLPIDGLGGLNRYDPTTGTFTRYLHRPNDPSSLINNKVRALLEDSKGNFWVGTSGDGLHLMDRKTGKFKRLTYDPENPGKLSRPFITGLSPSDHLIFHHVTSLFEDKDGRIWITAHSGGLNVYEPESGKTWHFEPIGDEVNQQVSFLWQTFQTRDGVLFLLSAGEGKTVFKARTTDKRFHFYDWENAGLPIGNRPTGITKDLSGNIWVGFTNGVVPLIRFDRSTGRAIPAPLNEYLAGKPGQAETIVPIYSLFTDRKGFLWLDTYKGLFRFDPLTNQTKQFLPDRNGTWIAGCVEDHAGKIWVGTCCNGIYHLDPETGQYAHFKHDPKRPESLGGTVIHSMYLDKSGSLWVGGGNMEDPENHWTFLDRFDQKRQAFEHKIVEKELGAVVGINEDEKKNLYFLDNFGRLKRLAPSEGNIHAYNPNRYSLKRVYEGYGQITNISIIATKGGRLWLYDANRLMEFDPTTGKLFQHLDLHGVPPVGTNRSALRVAYDGEVLVSGENGILAFYPDDIDPAAESKLPALQITDFRLFEKSILPGGDGPLKLPIWQTTELYLNYNQNTFGFTISCFDFYDPEAVQIEFILEGFDPTGWRTDHRNGETPPYVNVPPGTYTFRARGADSHGIWNEMGAAIEVVVLPPWWATWWFRLLLLSAIGAAIFTFVKNRLRNQQILLENQRLLFEKETALRNERDRIAAEMHDDLGAGLSTIRFLSLLAKEKESDLANADRIDQISRNASGIMEKMADIIWVMNSRNDSLANFAAYIRRYAGEYLEMHGIRFSFEIPAGLPPKKLSGEQRRTLLLAVKECLHNVVKHAGATEVAISLKANGTVEIEVKDNGKGIPHDLLERFEKNDNSLTGNGLHNLRHRMEALGGGLVLENKKGTTVRLRTGIGYG